MTMNEVFANFRASVEPWGTSRFSSFFRQTRIGISSALSFKSHEWARE